MAAYSYSFATRQAAFDALASLTSESARRVFDVVSRIGGLNASEIAAEAGVDVLETIVVLRALEKASLVFCGSLRAYFPGRDAYRVRV